MLEDNFIIGSEAASNARKANSTNVNKFFKAFHKFYYEVKMGKNPNFVRNLCDPFGFALLCKDYPFDVYIDKSKNCRAIYDGYGKRNNTEYAYYKGMFNFKQLLTLLYRGYLFDYNLAVDIYNMQHDSLDIFKKIMYGQGYVVNRFDYSKTRVRRYYKSAYPSKLTLNEDNNINIPYIHRLCDGIVFPVIVSPYNRGLHIETLDSKNYGNGLCILDNNDNIVDVLRINDTTFIDNPLENRLKFANNFKGHDVIQYGKAWSLRSAFDIAKMCDANRTNGVLLRPCYQDFFNNTWFQWCETSVVFCCEINEELVTFNTKKSDPDYFTLGGDLAELNPVEKRVDEKMWLDNFDIKEFQRILELKKR